MLLSMEDASGILVILVPAIFHKVCSVNTKMGSSRSVLLFELAKLQQRQKIMQFISCNQCLAAVSSLSGQLL